MIILKWTYSDNEYVSDDGERHDCTLFQHGLLVVVMMMVMMVMMMMMVVELVNEGGCGYHDEDEVCRLAAQEMSSSRAHRCTVPCLIVYEAMHGQIRV